jgi:hypothetical protein
MAHNIWVKERRNFKRLNIGICKLFKLHILNFDPINNILLNRMTATRMIILVTKTYIRGWMENYGIQRIQGLKSFEIFNIGCHLLKYALKYYNKNVTFQ